ncbi:hypothetical protein ABEO66_11040 [Bacillus pacificus]
MTTQEYIINKQGAKMYSDVNKHEVLSSIPKIKSNKEQGAFMKYCL